MEAVINIGWFLALMITIFGVYNTVGHRGLTAMFPEGRRWWHLPTEIIALGLFAITILRHPF